VVVSVRHALLALLSEGPKYGLQLRQEFEARTGEVWPLNVGQVYTTLQRLERDGLVASEGAESEGPQKGFRITSAGSDELKTWLRTPPDAWDPPRDELVIKVMVAIGLPGVEVHDVIQAHRRHLVEVMQRYTSLKADTPDHDVALALVVDAQIFRLEAIIRWLDAADNRLSQHPGTVPEVATSAVSPMPPRLARRSGRVRDEPGLGAAPRVQDLRVGAVRGAGPDRRRPGRRAG
jgi:DNA-binding PadR family transcriptional regulator